ncbi:MAG: ISAs1 family transposase, partial [Paracoccaceae bacterium]
LGQIAVEEKSNEITAVPKLLAMLSLDGTIVTADALNCQRDTAERIIDQGGDYVLALKGNQETLFDDVKTFLDDPEASVSAATEVDGGHGRIEDRSAVISSDIDWLQERHHWPGLKAIGKVTAIREANGKTTRQSRYYLLSTTLSAERFNSVVREHWGIENRLHWVLDMVMNEDQARNRKDNGPNNLAILRHMALNIIKADTSKGSNRGKETPENNRVIPTCGG